MDVGKGCVISDKWIPEGLPTGLTDINGVDIKTADRIALDGCTSDSAIVGRDMYNKFVLFFGGNNGSVSWGLTKETIDGHNIRVLK